MVNIIWALLDLAIVYTYFRLGRRELPEFVTRAMFIAMFVARWGCRGGAC